VLTIAVLGMPPTTPPATVYWQVHTRTDKSSTHASYYNHTYRNGNSRRKDPPPLYHGPAVFSSFSSFGHRGSASRAVVGSEPSAVGWRAFSVVVVGLFGGTSQ
jgi:hypothetical protein